MFTFFLIIKSWLYFGTVHNYRQRKWLDIWLCLFGWHTLRYLLIFSHLFLCLMFVFLLFKGKIHLCYQLVLFSSFRKSCVFTFPENLKSILKNLRLVNVYPHLDSTFTSALPRHSMLHSHLPPPVRCALSLSTWQLRSLLQIKITEIEEILICK